MVSVQLCFNPSLPLFLGCLHIDCLFFLLAAVGLAGEFQVLGLQPFLSVVRLPSAV